MIFTVKQTFKHSKGRISSLHNDIALLKLQGSVKIGENIWPICLPTRPYFDPRAIKTGFGETDKDMLSQHLLKDEVGRLDQQICTNFYGEYFNETTMMCYEHQTERRNTCVVRLNLRQFLKSIFLILFFVHNFRLTKVYFSFFCD